MSQTDKQHFYRFFRDATPTIEMNIDGDAATTSYTIEHIRSVHEILRIVRVNFVMVQNNIKYGQFLGRASLTNGITIKWFDSDGNLKYDYLDGVPIKDTEDFVALSGVDAIAEPAAGAHSFPVRWTLDRSGIASDLLFGDYIQILIDDDLSTVTKFRAMAQGYLDP